MPLCMRYPTSYYAFSQEPLHTEEETAALEIPRRRNLRFLSRPHNQISPCPINEGRKRRRGRCGQSAGLGNWDVIPRNGGGTRGKTHGGRLKEATRIQEKQPELGKIFKANRRIFLKKEMDNDVCLFIFK